MCRTIRPALMVFAWLAIVPAAAYAQASITGVVRDTSGGVLPGVTVGENAFVAAGSVVTEDVPPNTLAVGTPAKEQPLPKPLEGANQLV